MTIGISISDHFSVPWQFAESMIGLISAKPQAKVLRAHGSLIHYNRQWLLQNCKDKGILMVDTDIVFTPGDVDRLLETMKETGAAIVTGCYKQGYPPYPFALFDEQLNKLFELPALEPFAVGACGMGFCLIDSAAFDISFDPILEERHGEDVSFCIRAREKGLKIICDPRVQVGHLRLLPV